MSHELIHHVQNCRGDLGGRDTELGYAQDDKHMRGMEHEAYTMGNIMNFRDFEDNYKKKVFKESLAFDNLNNYRKSVLNNKFKKLVENIER